jgi:hypothetical protein
LTIFTGVNVLEHRASKKDYDGISNSTQNMFKEAQMKGGSSVK